MLSEEERQRRRRAQLREQRRRAAKKRRRRALLARTLFITIIVLIITGAVCLIKHFKNAKETSAQVEPKIVENPPDYEVDLLDINDYSRPGLTLEKVNGIVIHYTANPGTTAKQNRNYFNGLKDSKKTKASAHFVVGLEGEIVQCIPCNEIAYASNERNSDTISIECCHPGCNRKIQSGNEGHAGTSYRMADGTLRTDDRQCDPPLRCYRQKMSALLCGA